MRNYKQELRVFTDEIAARKYDYVDVITESCKRTKYVCVFGIGAISYPVISAIRKFTDIRIDFLSDNDQSKWDATYHGDLKCISPSELEKYKDDVTVIVTTRYYREIYKQLRSRGFHRVFVTTEYRLRNNEYLSRRGSIETVGGNALKLIDILEDERSREIASVVVKNWFALDIEGKGYTDIFTDDQYYPPGIIKLTKEEAFVDVGAYDGDTILEFLGKTEGSFDAIYAFELDGANFREMEVLVNGLDPEVRKRIALYNLGLSDEEKNVKYETGGSRMSTDFMDSLTTASSNGRTVRLSDTIRNKRVTFIKMDIEGTELRALHGAEEVIRRQKPKLAVCVYHRPEHLWKVPLYLKGIVPEYRIYLRHHNPLEYETICYAVA
jgi:FkbM family methyltransferase